MRHNNFFLSALSVGLLYSSLYMGVIVVSLRGTLRAGNMDHGVTGHYVVTLLCGLVFYLFTRKGVHVLRLFCIFCFFTALFVFIVPLLPEALFVHFSSGSFPILALSMAFFTIIALCLFARSVPAGREAFSFAILIACSELLWALFFPLLDIVSAATSQYEAHLFSLCCWMVGGAGLFLSRLLASAEKKPETVESDYNKFYEYKKWHIIAIAFIAGAVIMVMMGFQMGVFIPKMTFKSEFLGMPHFLFLFSLPFIGWIIDSHPIKVIKVLVPVLLCIFILSLLYNAEYIRRMPLYYLLNIMQEIVLVLIYAVTTKLLRMHNTLPAFIALAHSLLLLQYVGLLLRRLVSNLFGLAMVSLLLVMLMGACLWYFYGLILARRKQGFVSYDISKNKESEDSKFSAFAAVHMLTARERDVLLCLLQGVYREDMEEKLGIAERTLRHHIANLQKKSNMPNEKSMLDYYNSWKAK